MKKSMIALAVLAAAAGTAQAASSVTLYGRVDVGYTRTTGDVVTQVTQAGAGQTRLGIKGQEDLGDGYAATFQLEGRFNGDDGSKNPTLAFFDRESTVGLKTPYGSIRFGRSLASMERALGFANIGRRTADISPYASAARQSNAAFYDATFGGVSFGAHLTTRATAGDEGVGANPKAAYGAYAKYAANGLTASAGYQKDGDNANNTKEWGVGLGYSMNPVFVNATYASRKDEADVKTNNLYANLGAKVSANDTVAAVFKRTTIKQNGDSDSGNVYGLEYVHAMSKRTSVYANVATIDGDVVIWDLALQHNF